MNQIVFNASNNYKELEQWIDKHSYSKILLVCGKSIQLLKIKGYLDCLEREHKAEFSVFSEFEPNPVHTSVVRGIRQFQKERCEGILVIGGGSAIDVAKCIKLYADTDAPDSFLQQKPAQNNIALFAIPTTSGSGSEATRFAVVYKDGVKQSVSDEACIPEAVLLDSSVLKTLPIYQKKSTMMDAFCHALESFWSINSTPESQKYASEAIKEILSHMGSYLNNDEDGNLHMLYAANLAGRAINISQTTAGHAMCYKITGLYGIPHGHAAAMCVRKLLPWMVNHLDQCTDSRGKAYLEKVFSRIADTMECRNVLEASAKFEKIYHDLGLSIPSPTEAEYEMLSSSVNQTRLGNNPVRLDKNDIRTLYRQIFENSME